MQDKREKEILLLNLPDNLLDPYDNQLLLQPIGLASISSFLKVEGYSVSLVDAAACYFNFDQIIQYIRKVNPAILALPLYTHQVPAGIMLLQKIKEIFPRLFVIVGGAHPSVECETLMKNHTEIDVAIIGEGEYTMAELLGKLQKQHSLESVKGVAYRDSDSIVVNPMRPFIENLDVLPFCDWDSLPMKEYWYNYTVKKNYVALVFSRGCPLQCTFCAKNLTGEKQRKRSPGNILEELVLLYDKYQVRDLLIADASLNLDSDWLKEICEGMIRLNRPFLWGAQIRADRVNRDTIRLMKRSGCRNLFIGVESADSEMLKKMKKGETIEKIREGITIMEQEGVFADLGFIIGLPGETEESIKKTIFFAREFYRHQTAWNIAAPFPGTEFYEMAKKEGFAVNDWSKVNIYKMSYVTKDLTEEELQYYYKKAVRESYLRFAFLWAQIRNLRSWVNFRIKLKMAYRIFFGRFFELRKQRNII